MSLDFLYRSMRVAGVLVVLTALFAAVYVGPWFGAAVGAGGAWNVLNLLLLTLLVTTAFGPGASRRKLLLLALLKFPLLYGGGWWLLTRTPLPAGGVLAGFGLPLLAVLLRALGARRGAAGRATAAGRSTDDRRAGRVRAAALLLAVALPLAAFGASSAALAQGHEHEGDGHEAEEATGHGDAMWETHDAGEHASTAHEEHAPAAHGEEHGGDHGGGEHEGGVPELANWLIILHHWKPENAALLTLHDWMPIAFSLFAALLFVVLVRAGTRHRAIVPGRFQAAIELPFGFIHDMVTGVMGDEGRRYVPFAATLFLYILLMNLQGLVPGMYSPTSSLNVTLGLAICTFLYVQLNAIRTNGPIGYVHHLAGSPRDPVGWAMMPLMLPLHVLEEFIKPISLSLRLFGNVLGEDALIAQFAILGIMVTSAISPHIPVGIPFQTPIMLLALLTGTIQALVFTMLSTMYIFLMLPHEEHH